MSVDDPLHATTRTADPAALSPAGRRVLPHTPVSGGFAPGTLIGNRFRIIGLLGVGGMGEVYRADDLTLGQAVALKFLPQAVAADAVWRERLYSEVRLARQVAHPNVCRVYDVGEVEGRYFLSMEYIDGEDLSSLIKRIGHLPASKVIELAHELSAGLAAAHVRGVLHRDLKPRNIMVDGRGHVRITDFGLAVTIDRPRDSFISPGTPLYMAPEQFLGKPASIQSDIYALGLVLYELATGHQPFHSKTTAELRIEKQELAPPAPSELAREIDPKLDRVIMRCIERDPVARPGSVLQVVAALPGGDPLAATIAAGETPSPEMVAAATTTERFSAANAAALLAALAVVTAVAVWLGSVAIFNRRAPLERPPEALVERARAMIAHAGLDTGVPVRDRAYGINYGDAFLRFVVHEHPTPRRWDHLTPDAVRFWYRQSAQSLRRLAFSIGVSPRVTIADPPLGSPGDVLVIQNGAGRLVQLVAVPPASSASIAPSAEEPEWGALFADAGLTAHTWHTVPAIAAPPFWADRRIAWEPTRAMTPESPTRVEAASVGRQVVAFHVIYRWDLGDRGARSQLFYDRGFGAEDGPGARVANLVGIASTGIAMFGGLLFARRNLRLGRGDRRGASRLAVFLATMLTASWLLDEHHLADAHEWYLLISFAGRTLVVAGIVWWTYVAFEPYVRRHWPAQLVSWSRVLTGAIRDPLVGRDILIGCVAGAALTALVLASYLLPGWLGWPAERLAAPSWHAWLGPRHALSLGLQLVCNAMLEAFTALFIVVLTRILFRRELLAALVAALLLATPDILLSEHAAIAAVMFTTIYFIGVMVLLRVGLLAVIALRFCVDLLQVYPVTFDSSAWYAGLGISALVTLTVIVGVSSHLAMKRGRDSFSDLGKKGSGLFS